MSLTDFILDYSDPVAATLGAVVSILMLLFLISGVNNPDFKTISYGYLFVYLINIGYQNMKKSFSRRAIAKSKHRRI